MSLETWIAEFYPTHAKDTRRQEALAHSLKKWEGALPENLQKHKCVLRFLDWQMAIANYDDPTGIALRFNATTCALCYHHFQRQDQLVQEGQHACRTCPIFLTHGHDCSYEFKLFSAHGQPEPMINLLKSTKP